MVELLPGRGHGVEPSSVVEAVGSFKFVLTAAVGPFCIVFVRRRRVWVGEQGEKERGAKG